jgi:intracellular multiplication protein IcmO
MPFTIPDLLRLRLGGTKDNLALSAIGASALVANPLIGLPTAIGAAAGALMAGAGGYALANRLSDILALDVFDLRDPDGVSINSSEPPPVEGDGVHIGYCADTGEPLVLPLDAWTRHVSIAGMTGVGKTVLANWLMFQQVMRGGGLLFIDGKIDADNVAFMRAMCAAAGREHDLLILNPGDPENSNSYNPFLNGSPDEVAARMLALIPSSESNPGTDYYRSAAAQSMTILIGALQATGKAYNALDIATMLQSDKVMMKVRDMMDDDADATKQFDQWYQRFALYGKDGSYQGVDMKKLNDTLGGITGKIFQFGVGDFGKICNAYAPDIVFEDVILQNKILYLALPTLGKKEAAGQFGKLAIGDLRSATARIQQMPKPMRPNPSFLAFLDEAGSYLTQAASTLAEQARSAGVTLAPAVQTKANYDQIDKGFTDQMAGNSLTRIYFKTNEPNTQRWIEEMCGMEEQVQMSLSTSHSASASSASIASGKIRGDSEGGGIGFSESIKEVPRVPASAIGALGQGECIVQFEGNKIYHVKIPFLDFTPELRAELGPVQVNRFRKKSVAGVNAFSIAEKEVAKRRKKQSGEE